MPSGCERGRTGYIWGAWGLDGLSLQLSCRARTLFLERIDERPEDEC